MVLYPKICYPFSPHAQIVMALFTVVTLPGLAYIRINLDLYKVGFFKIFTGTDSWKVRPLKNFTLFTLGL